MRVWLIVMGLWNLAPLGFACLMYHGNLNYRAGPAFYGLLSAAALLSCAVALSGRRTADLFWLAVAVSAIRPLWGLFTPIMFGASGHADMMGWFLAALCLGPVDLLLAIAASVWRLILIRRSGRSAEPIESAN